MNRDKHLFQFTGSQISRAALIERDYHLARLEHWREEQEKAIARAKSAGVEIREYDVSGGRRAEMVIDTTLTNRMSECASKIQSHRQAAERFDIEGIVYGTQKDRMYELQADDVVYFRLGGGLRDA